MFLYFVLNVCCCCCCFVFVFLFLFVCFYSLFLIRSSYFVVVVVFWCFFFDFVLFVFCCCFVFGGGYSAQRFVGSRPNAFVLVPTAFMLRVSFSPVPECVVSGCHCPAPPIPTVPYRHSPAPPTSCTRLTTPTQ